MAELDPDPREEKLPKWARELLSALRSRVSAAEEDYATLKKQLEDLPENIPSDTVLVVDHVISGGDDVPDRPLGNGARIRFADFYEVMLDQTPGVGFLLTLKADGPIAVIPTSDSQQIRVWKLAP